MVNKGMALGTDGWMDGWFNRRMDGQCRVQMNVNNVFGNWLIIKETQNTE